MKTPSHSTFALLATVAGSLLFHSAIVGIAAAAPTYSEWSAPVNLGPIVNSASGDQGAAMSKDGRSLYFTSDRPGGFGGADIWVSQRVSVGDPWGPPQNLGPTVNTAAAEGVPAFSRDEHWIFFNSDRAGGFGGSDIWAARRTHTHDDFGWEAPVNLGSGVNSAATDSGASYFANDDAGTPLLYFGSNRPGGIGAQDIYVSEQAADGSFGPAKLVPELSSPDADQRPVIRFDGLEIFLFSTRAGGLGGYDLWSSMRSSVLDGWSTPVNLGAVVNTAANEQQPFISSDRRILFFMSDRAGGVGSFDLYATTREKAGGK